MDQLRKQQLCLDAIEYSFSMARTAYQRVATYGAIDPENRDAVLDEAMVLDAWSCVDVIKRLRSVLERTPGLKASTALKLFMQQTAEIPSFRHYVQHIDEKVGETAPTGRPIWGSFSWVQLDPDPNQKAFKIVGYVPGRLAKTKGIPLVNPAGRAFHDRVDHFEMTVGSDTINLSEAVRHVEELRLKFECALARASSKTLGSGEVIMLIDLDA